MFRLCVFFPSEPLGVDFAEKKWRIALQAISGKKQGSAKG